MGAEQSADEYQTSDASKEWTVRNANVHDSSRFSGNPQDFIRFFRAWRARLENMFAEGKVIGATHADCCAVLANHLPSGDPADMRVKINEASLEELRKLMSDRGLLESSQKSIISTHDRNSLLAKLEEYLNTPTPGRLVAERYIYNSLVQVAQQAYPAAFEDVGEDPLRGSKTFEQLRHYFVQRNEQARQSSTSGTYRWNASVRLLESRRAAHAAPLAGGEHNPPAPLPRRAGQPARARCHPAPLPPCHNGHALPPCTERVGYRRSMHTERVYGEAD
jgi:hypothetical protein